MTANCQKCITPRKKPGRGQDLVTSDSLPGPFDHLADFAVVGNGRYSLGVHRSITSSMMVERCTAKEDGDG